jgi:hypothetical protein
MYIEKIDWSEKTSRWKNNLAEIEEFLDSVRQGYRLEKDLRLSLWDELTDIVQDFHDNFMDMWKYGEFKRIDEMMKLIEIVLDDMLSLAL